MAWSQRPWARRDRILRGGGGVMRYHILSRWRLLAHCAVCGPAARAGSKQRGGMFCAWAGRFTIGRRFTTCPTFGTCYSGITVPSSEVAADTGQAEQLYSALVEKVRSVRPNEDLSALDNAYHVAVEAHKGQTRISGEPYVIHPLHVTHILADMQMDLVCLETGLLHDTIEDTKLKLEDIKRDF